MVVKMIDLRCNSIRGDQRRAEPTRGMSTWHGTEMTPLLAHLVRAAGLKWDSPTEGIGSKTKPTESLGHRQVRPPLS